MLLRVVLLLFISSLAIGGIIHRNRNPGSPAAPAPNCNECQVGAILVQQLSKSGNASIENMIKAAQFICIFLQIEDQTVCDSILMEFRDELVYSFANTPLSPQGICALAFGACPTPNTPFFNWKINLPPNPKPPVKPIPPPKPDAPKLRVLHLTDIHIDLDYQIGSNAACKEPLCCRQASGVPSNDSSKAGQFGDYRNCDMPIWTIENMFQHIVDNETFDYIVWTGDISPHNVWNQSIEFQLHNFYMVDALFKKYFPGKTIYASLGNHEGVPVDAFPPPFVKGPLSLDWLLDTLVAVWPDYNLPSSIIPTVQLGGYYSVKVAPNFRIISLNNNYCESNNYYLLVNMTDPAGQLQWLVDQLQEAEDNGEKVHIISHIPIASDDCVPAFMNNYHKIVNRYESTIVGLFHGHHHSDELKVLYDAVNKTRPVAMTYISPSTTTYSFLNSGYRVYEIDGIYDGSTYAVLNHYDVIADIGDANKKGALQWAPEYDAKSAFDMTQLNPTDWSAVIDSFETNDVMFQKIWQYYYKSYSGRPVCEGTCKSDFIRSMRIYQSP